MDEFYKDEMKETETDYYLMDQEAENTKKLVELLVQENKIEQALKATKSLHISDRLKLANLFKKLKPSPLFCEKCGGEIRQIFHDFSLSWHSTNYCPKCKFKEIKNRIAADAERIMYERGVGKRFLKARLTDFGEKTRKAVLNSSFIYGSRGVGKTHNVSAIMHNEILNVEPCKSYNKNAQLVYTEPELKVFPLMISAPELLFQIRATFGQRKETSEEEIIKKYSEQPVLILDDLGAERDTSWSVSILYLLINRRYEEELKTYITSNLSLDQIAERLDDRIASRIAGMCKIIQMDGQDRRLQLHALRHEGNS